MFNSSLSGSGGGEKKKKGLLHLEINQLAMHASSFGSIPRQFGYGANPATSPRNSIKKTQPQHLPSIGLGPLHIKLAQPTSTAAPAEKGAATPLVFSEENTHSFIQNTWSTFSNLSDSHRNQLLKGLLSRSSSQQIEFICTCLNIKSLENGTPGNPVPTKVFPETVLGKYLVNSRRKPENYHLKAEVAEEIKKSKNEETFKDAMKRAFGNEKATEDAAEFLNSSDEGSYLNSNTYVKLMNSNMSPESLSKQIASASPEGIKFLTSFLSNQCGRFQKILRAMDVISKQAELEKSAEKLFDLMLDVTDAKYATIYYSTTPGNPVKVYNNNWPYSRNTMNEDQIFASESVFKGDLVNVYNFGASDYYKASQSSHYHPVQPTCVLSAPFYGDGLRVTGILELIGKRTGTPIFTVEEELILQSLASIATILFNQLTMKQASHKKNDNLKAFLETASALPVAKIEVGDLVDVVMTSARELVNADRCTIFLYDEDNDELWSKLAHGSEPIRIPSDAGMAGHVFQTGKLVNTQDAYADPRFNQIVDKSSGYKTHTILSVPMINHENEVIGVMQAINKLPLGFVFNDDDIVQLQSFATLATSTLQKSNQIYELSQVVHEQRLALHYYQCMLQTGNDVSITIGADSRASSIENAHLIGFENIKSLMRATSFEHWLGRQNHQISDAISKVKSSSKPISVHYHIFYKPDRTPIICSYYVRRLKASGNDGLLPATAASSEVKKSMARRASRSRKQSIAEKSLEGVNTSSAPFGILVVISPILPNRIMIDQLACQLDQSIINEFLLEPSKIEGEQQPITNFAVNIRKFSALIKLLPPNKVNLLLNRYFEMLTTIANQYNGALVDTNGSFAQITFGIPFPNTNDASRAVDCALAVQKGLVELNKKTEDVGLPTIHISIGLSSGIGLCGAVGPNKMKKYTVMGNPVDDSLDMQWIANTYGAKVLVDINTKELIKDSYHLREVDLITYGQHSNLTLFEIMASTEDDTDHDILTTIISYELGLAEYRSKNWQAAIMHFKKSQTLTDDHPSKYMIERCRGLIDGKYEVAEDWAGGWTLGENKYALKGHDSFFSVGTDEHGLKIQQAAEHAKTDPKTFCDSVSVKFNDLFKRASIKPTDFIRTTESRHHKAVHHFWNQLEKGGFIYKGYHDGWYSVSDETFVPESQIEDRMVDGKLCKVAKDSGKIVEWTREENYKFKLSAFRRPLIAWLEENPKVIVPANQYKDVLHHLQENELADLSISRLKSRVSWGIRVPNDDDHVIYVWLDALTNYLTVTGYPQKQADSVNTKDGTNDQDKNLIQKWDRKPDWPAAWHIVGMDIIKFHAIYWPAFLMAANMPLPEKILSHGHWLVSNQKMSKSSGNGVDAVKLLDTYGVDAIRYFLLRDGGISINPEFSIDTIWRRYKHDLAGQLGNLAMRATSLKINPSGRVPDALITSPTPEEADIIASCLQLREKVDALVEQGLFADALGAISDLISSVNRYWSHVEPWHFDLSVDENKKKLDNILYVSCEALRISGILLQPVMPSIGKKLLDMLLVAETERLYEHAILDGSITRNRIIQPAKMLFPQIKQ